HDKHDEALPPMNVRTLRHAREPPQVNTARPTGRDFQFHGRLPLALAQTVGTDGRVGLRFGIQWPERGHEPCASAPVITHSENLDLEAARRVGTSHDLERLAGFDALMRAVSFHHSRAKSSRVD